MTHGHVNKYSRKVRHLVPLEITGRFCATCNVFVVTDQLQIFSCVGLNSPVCHLDGSGG